MVDGMERRRGGESEKKARKRNGRNDSAGVNSGRRSILTVGVIHVTRAKEFRDDLGVNKARQPDREMSTRQMATGHKQGARRRESERKEDLEAGR